MKQNNIILNGIAASSGVAIGKVFVLEEDEFLVEKKEISGIQIKQELSRLKDAMDKTKVELEENKKELSKVLGDNYAKIAAAHLLILNDPMVKNEIIKMIKEGAKEEVFSQRIIATVETSVELSPTAKKEAEALIRIHISDLDTVSFVVVGPQATTGTSAAATSSDASSSAMDSSATSASATSSSAAASSSAG